MLLRPARAALPARLLPREDRPHHRGLPLRGRRCVHANVGSSERAEPLGSLCLCASFAESNLDKSEVLRGIHEKSTDLRERAEAHLACSCSPQCV